jgi:DNA primase
LAESDALSTFFLNELGSRHALKEVEGRSALVHEARPLLALIPQITLKIQLQNEFARLAQLTPEELTALLEKEVTPALMGLPAAGQPGAGRAAGAAAGGASGRAAQGRGAKGGDASFSPSGPASEEFSGDDRSFQGYSDATGGGPEFGRSAGRMAGRQPAARVDRRAVAPMAKRLLRLLLTHPELVDVMGEQQLELLERGPHLEMVRELIVLAQASGARHVGALIQAADPGADLGVLMASVAEDLMTQEPLPNPQGEWEDALRRIELESLKSEQEALIAEGLNNLQSQQNYRELSSRITRLIGVIETSKAR